MDKLISEINKAESILIFTHINPDGDAIGSSFALAYMLKTMGKRVCAVLDEPLSDLFSMFSDCFVTPENVNEDYQLKIALDSSDKKRLGKAGALFSGKTMLIDHHETNLNYADINYVVPESSSTGEIIFDLAMAMGAEITRNVANGLYAAIMTDTGGFMYSNTTSATHIKVARLIEGGADYAFLNRKLYQEKTYEGHMLAAQCVEHMEFFFDGLVCISCFDFDFCEKYKVTSDNINGLSGYPRSVTGVQLGIFISELVKGKVKVSLRSEDIFDVSEISLIFGGGGHKKAAGFVAENAKIHEVKEELLRIAGERLKDCK